MAYCILVPSVVSSWPLVLYDRVPHATQEQHDRSSVCRQQPTSSGTHHRHGSISSAAGSDLRLDASPQTNPSELQ
jgi:hypothetical protein